MNISQIRSLSKNLFSPHEAVKKVSFIKLGELIRDKKITNISGFPLIHEGLFYMYWESDKPQRQYEDANKIAQLMTYFVPGVESNTTKQSETANSLSKWIQEQFYCLRRHWNKIDYLRIDKFLKLVRILVGKIFEVLKAGSNWEEDTREKIINSLLESVFGTKFGAEGESDDESEDQEEKSAQKSLLGQDGFKREALGIPLQFFQIWDQQFMRIYMPNQLDSEEDKEDKKNIFGHNDYQMIFKKILEIYARMDVADIRKRIEERIEIILANPNLPLTKSSIIKSLFDAAKKQTTLEKSRTKLYALMKQQMSDKTENSQENFQRLMDDSLKKSAKDSPEKILSPSSSKNSSPSKDSDVMSPVKKIKLEFKQDDLQERQESTPLKEQAEQNNLLSQSSETSSKFSNIPIAHSSQDEIEISEMIPKLLKKRNKKLSKRLVKFMNKRKEQSARMKKRAHHMAEFGLPIQMWIADGQRKEVKRLANIEWEQLQKDIQKELDSAEKKQGIKKKSQGKKGRKVKIADVEEQVKIVEEEQQESLQTETIDNEKTKKKKEKAKKQKKKNKKASEDNNTPFESELEEDQEAQIDLLLQNDEQGIVGGTSLETKVEEEQEAVKVKSKKKANALSIEERMRLAQLKLEEQDDIQKKSQVEPKKTKKKKTEQSKKIEQPKPTAPTEEVKQIVKTPKTPTTPPRNTQKKKSPTISPVKSSLQQLREQTLEIINQNEGKKKSHKKKKRSKSNDTLRMSMNAPLMTRNQKAVHFSPKTTLKTFHTNQVVSLKKIPGSKFKKVPETGIMKKRSKFS